MTQYYYALYDRGPTAIADGAAVTETLVLLSLATINAWSNVPRL